jgi:hypothetical protein
VSHHDKLINLKYGLGAVEDRGCLGHNALKVVAGDAQLPNLGQHTAFGKLLELHHPRIVAMMVAGDGGNGGGGEGEDVHRDGLMV